MIRNVRVLCCEVLLRDQETNTISAIKIYDDISPLGYPFLLSHLSILHVMSRDPEDPELVPTSIKLLFEGKEIFTQNVDAGFQGKTRTRTLVTFTGIPFEKPGVLTVEVTPKDVGPISYDIEFQQPQIINMEKI